MNDTNWREIAPGLGLYVLEYEVPSLGIPSNCIAFRMGEGEIGVLSPSIAPTAEVFEGLARLGRLVACVAPNIGHDLGLRPWQQRFTDVPFYASTATAAAVAKAKPDLRPLRPLSELLPLLPDGVRLWESPGISAGTVFMSVSRGGHSVLYLDDLVAHLPALPAKQPFKFVFWATGSAPGLKLSRVFKFFFVKDGASVARSLLEDARQHAPDLLMFAHGAETKCGSVAELETLLAPLGG